MYFKPYALFLLLLLPLGVFGQFVSKTIEKQFPLAAEGTFTLNNLFGNVNIESWEKEQVDVKVVVKVYGKKDEDSAERLDNIYPVFETAENRVSVTTVIEKQKNKSWWKIFNWFESNTERIQIDYWVKLPATAELKTKNNYGSTYIDRHLGPTSLDIAYGNLAAEELRHENNRVVIKYSDDSEIELINGGTVVADYSDLHIGEAEDIELDADYSKTKIESITDLGFSVDYGKLEIGKVATLEGDADYVGIRIEELTKSSEIDLDYGALKIYHVLPSTQRVDISADYAGLSLGIDPNWGFDFEVITEYASLKTDLDLDYKQRIIEQVDRYYQGRYKSGEGKLKITSDYGAVKLYKN